MSRMRATTWERAESSPAGWHHLGDGNRGLCVKYTASGFMAPTPYNRKRMTRKNNKDATSNRPVTLPAGG